MKGNYFLRVSTAFSKEQISAWLPGGRRHGHFIQMWQFLKAEWPGKFVAVKVAVKGF
jgi:hypothetical protein